MYEVPGGAVAAKGKTVAEYLTIRTLKNKVRLVMDEYEASKRWLEARREKWLELARLYIGYVDPSKKVKGRANFHFHQVMPQVELEASRYLISYFMHNPYVQVLPSNGTSVDAAKAREQVLQHYYEHSPTHFYETFRFMKYTLMYGCAFRVPSWRRTFGKITKRVKMPDGSYQSATYEGLTYDGLWFTTYSPLEVFPYPYAKSMATIPSLCIEEFVHIDELVARAKSGAFDLDAVMKIPLNCDGQTDMAYKLVQERTGNTSPDSDPYMVRLVHRLSRDSFMCVANSAQTIRDDSNIFWHGQIPCVMGVKTINPDSFYPIGSAEPIATNQKLTSFTVNNMVNQMVRGLDPVWWKTSDSGIDERYLISRPNHVIPVNKGAYGQSFGLVEMPEMKHDLFRFKELLDQNNQIVTGYSTAQRGYSAQRNTATAETIFEAQGDKRINADVMSFEELSAVPEAKQTSGLVEQFMPEEVALRISGAKGMDFLQRTPEDIMGEFDYRVGGMTENINRAVQQDQLLRLVELSNNMNQLVQMADGQLVPMPVLNVYEAVRNLFEATVGVGTAEKMILTPELFGMPVDNQLFAQYGLPAIPGLENMGGGPMLPRRALSMRPGSTSPGRIAAGPVARALTPQRLF